MSEYEELRGYIEVLTFLLGTLIGGYTNNDPNRRQALLSELADLRRQATDNFSPSRRVGALSALDRIETLVTTGEDSP